MNPNYVGCTPFIVRAFVFSGHFKPHLRGIICHFHQWSNRIHVILKRSTIASYDTVDDS